MPHSPFAIPVTAQHIHQGLPNDPAKCAVAQALHAYFGPELEQVEVTQERIILDMAGQPDRTYWPNSAPVQDWLRRYDLRLLPPEERIGFNLSVEFDPRQGDATFYREQTQQ